MSTMKAKTSKECRIKTLDVNYIHQTKDVNIEDEIHQHIKKYIYKKGILPAPVIVIMMSLGDYAIKQRKFGDLLPCYDTNCCYFVYNNHASFEFTKYFGFEYVECVVIRKEDAWPEIEMLDKLFKK